MLAQLTADGQALRDLGIGVICDLRDAERTLEPTPFRATTNPSRSIPTTRSSCASIQFDVSMLQGGSTT
jgi:hypothetical protein